MFVAVQKSTMYLKKREPFIDKKTLVNLKFFFLNKSNHLRFDLA